MPDRDQVKYGLVSYISGKTQLLTKAGFCAGNKQHIDYLNYGRYVPGEYCCNPNRIVRSDYDSSESSFLNKTYKNGNGQKITASLEGHLIPMALSGIIGGVFQSVDSITALEQQEAVNKAYAKLLQNDLDVGTMIGELRETVEGLRNPLKALRKEYLWFRNNYAKWNTLEEWLLKSSGKRAVRLDSRIADIKHQLAEGAPSRSINALASTWLEWRYGIRPLIQTVLDVIEHIRSQSRDFDGKMMKRKGKTAEVTSTSSYSGSSGFVDYSWSASCTIEMSSQVVASVAYRMESPLTWQERYGVDLMSIPGIAWELTTLSFVWDWFFGIGTWLGALRVQLNPKVTVLGVSVSKRVTKRLTGKLDKMETTTYVPSMKASHVADSAGTYTANLSSLQRVCLPPGFNAVFPALNSKALDLQKSIDLLCLIYQRLK